MKKLLKKIDVSYIYSFLGEATLGLTFVLYILLGRFLGPEQYGIFTSANALAGILTFFILFGFSTLLSRDIAANPEEGLKSTSLFLFTQTLTGLVVLLCLFPLTQLLGFSGNEIFVCYLVVLAGGFRCGKQTLRAVFRGLQQFGGETISVTLERTALFLCTFAALYFTQSLLWVVGTMALIRFLDVVGLYTYLGKKFSIRSQISRASIWRSFKLAYPFAVSGILWILYYQVDMLMLKGLAPATEAGFYGAAYSLIEIFSALPRVIFYVAFPKLTKCFANEPERLPEQLRQSTLMLLGTVLPFVTLAGFGQTYLVTLTYGDAFRPAIAPLALLLPSLSMKMFASLTSYFLQATKREKLLPNVLLATVIFNVLCNAVLIPQLGAVGAAIATLLSELIFATVGLILIMRVGYQKIGLTLLIVAIFGLVVASIPSLLLYGLNNAIAIGLMAASLVSIAALMRRVQPA